MSGLAARFGALIRGFFGKQFPSHYPLFAEKTRIGPEAAEGPESNSMRLSVLDPADRRGDESVLFRSLHQEFVFANLFSAGFESDSNPWPPYCEQAAS
jgi:hypothetical protein